jgi:ribosomal protein L3 glutamine methyltransferase
VVKLSSVISDLHTIRDFVRWGISRFNQADLYYGHGTTNAKDEALVLITHTLFLPSDIDETFFDARLTGDEKERLVKLFNRRVDERIPVPYLTGEAWFLGLPYKVDKRVIIPRSPIAELIENSFQPWLGENYPQRILDMCSGSGCIGIACAHQFEGAHVDLIDLSEQALAIANENIAMHGLEYTVSAIKSDMFTVLNSEYDKYDLIVSNPPYVDAGDFYSMPVEFSHEPKMALTAGEDGLEMAHILLAQAADYLTDDGVLIVEVGNSGEALEHCYPNVEFNWLEFDRGGVGVFAITAKELRQLQAQIG